MLVLKRKKNESIMIGHDIELKILGIEGDTIKLGIEAPSHVDIYRKEIYVQIQQSNRESLAPDIDDLQSFMKGLIDDSK